MQAEMLDSVVSSNSQELSDASSAIKLFENPLFKARVIMRCSDPWFVAKDVATCIEHSNVSKMCELCRDKDKIVIGMDEIATNDLLVTNMTRELLCISESGLYRILAKCNLPKCEPFESWVFDEVLPSIRKTGSYSVKEHAVSLPNFCNPAEAARAWADLYEKNQAAEKRAITAESERDEAIRTKAQIGSQREAKAMATASVKTRECKRLTAENTELREENVTLKDGWWSVSDVTRMIARVCKLPRVYAVGTLSSKCRIGLRYFAAKRNRMTRMLEVDGTHQDKYGNLVQNTAEHFDDDTVADFRQWVDENPDLFSKIQSILVITMNDEKPSCGEALR